jgi:hypothetical protein
VGLPNVGKSTIFNALTRSAQALAANYPFATIEPNIGEVPVPDPRLDVLAEISASAKIVPASMRFVDIAGLVRGASSGQGLGNAFLSHIRETDAIAMVVRCFADDNVTHVEGVHRTRCATSRSFRSRCRSPIWPRSRRSTTACSARCASTRRRRLARGARPADRRARKRNAGAFLSRGVARSRTRARVVLAHRQADALRRQRRRGQIAEPGPMTRAVFAHAAREGSRAIAFDGKVEAEFAGMSDEDVAMFRADFGITSGGLDRLIVEAYDSAGPDDVPDHR